jgi:hypothetical protein
MKLCGSTDPPVRCADAARRGRLKARHDEDWFFRALVVVPVTAFALMAGLSAAGQRTPAAGEPWDLARTPDGQPDIQGFWRDQEGGLSGCSLETGFCNQDNARLLGIRDGLQAVRKAITTGKPVTAIIDPPDGKIPYSRGPQPYERKGAIGTPSRRPRVRGISIRSSVVYWGCRVSTIFLNSRLSRLPGTSSCCGSGPARIASFLS